MSRECDERMWNLAYRLARSGEHRNYQAIEWELRAFGYPQAGHLLDHEQARARLNGLCAEAQRIRKCLEQATEKLTASLDSYSPAYNQNQSASGWESAELPPDRKARFMPTAEQYRAKAAEFTELLKTTSLPADTREFRRLEQSFVTLAENIEWMAGNLGKMNSPDADENHYGGAILERQGKHTPGCRGADMAAQSTAIPMTIQQLYDDAGSLRGLLQTATPGEHSSGPDKSE